MPVLPPSSVMPAPLRRQVTWARSASVLVPPTCTLSALTLIPSPSSPPPSVRVKSSTFTASPAESTVLSRATGSVTPVAATSVPSLLGTSAVSVALSAVVREPELARSTKVSSSKALAV